MLVKGISDLHVANFRGQFSVLTLHKLLRWNWSLPPLWKTWYLALRKPFSLLYFTGLSSVNLDGSSSPFYLSLVVPLGNFLGDLNWSSILHVPFTGWLKLPINIADRDFSLELQTHISVSYLICPKYNFAFPSKPSLFPPHSISQQIETYSPSAWAKHLDIFFFPFLSYLFLIEGWL